MELNLNQWRFQQQEDESASPAKIARLFFDSQIIKQEDDENNRGKTDYSVPPQLHLFVPTDTDTDTDADTNHQVTAKLTTTSLSAYPSHHPTDRRTKMGGGVGSYFSYGQWQELELQALIYRHMLAGAAIPSQLLQMVQKSLFKISPSPTNSLSACYAHPLQHYSHYHPALLQSGYWDRAAMDPEPGRCRRTDGKKWRCSWDVVGGHKYCERHIHRGRNRSRKPVELPTTTNTANETTRNATSGPLTEEVPACFDMSRPPASIEPFILAQRPSGSQAENKFIMETENKATGNLKPGGQALRSFFDELSNRSSETSNSPTTFSISASGNTSSDFSLQLATGNGNQSVERERNQSGWGGSRWGPASQVAPMGGPLAEALRSSQGSNASPTSVLNLAK